MLKQRDYTLVLGAGGLKGLAHIGVLSALEEHDFLPTDVVGCSVGAIVAAAWCSGISTKHLREIALELKRRDLFRIAHSEMALKRMKSPSLYRREPLEEFIHGLLGGITFDELERPLLVNTVDINAGSQVFWGAPGLTDVPVADAVFASCALPGYLPPGEIRGRFFIDGATVSNLPVRVAAARKRDLVLAVDVGSTGAVRAEQQEAGFAAVYARAIEIAIQTMRTSVLRDWGQPPLVLLEPRVEHIPMFSFQHNAELLELGYEVASQILTNPDLIPGPDCSGVFPRRRFRVDVDRARCIGCGGCLVHAPQGMFFIDDEGKAVITEQEQTWSPVDGDFVQHCPTYAIVPRHLGEASCE
ncbi:MAG: patatin-like phospholipase family protein [Gemmatimonadales bacterium]